MTPPCTLRGLQPGCGCQGKEPGVKFEPNCQASSEGTCCVTLPGRHKQCLLAPLGNNERLAEDTSKSNLVNQWIL